MNLSDFQTLDANEAVARVAYALNEVIAIYPITPATPMGERADAWSAAGRKNLWGTVPTVIMRLPLRWIAILHGQIRASLAATSGIHRGTDALKMLMAGTDVTMLCSVLMARGIDHIRSIEREILEWMEEHDYDSIEQLKGSMSQRNCPDPSAFERAQYMRAVGTMKAPL